jgi:hypothetical protein
MGMSSTQAPSRVSTGFKEWAVICQALGSGEQVLILRKGGLAEEGGVFRPEHRRFLLIPTYFHQQPEGILPSHRAALEATMTEASHEAFAIRWLAEVAGAYLVTSVDTLRALRPFHIWSDAIVEERLHRWRREQAHALVVRVSALSTPARRPNLPSYAGCKSWINVEEPVDVSGATPVLDDRSFAGLKQRIKAILG